MSRIVAVNLAVPEPNPAKGVGVTGIRNVGAVKHARSGASTGATEAGYCHKRKFQDIF